MKKRCVIIGASPDMCMDLIVKNVREDDFIVCADGGYEYAFRAGLKPDLIIGDFDSASEFPKDTGCKIISLPTEKDDTDTMYCIKECVKMGYKEFVFLGMTGGRCDHTYANYCALLYLSERDIKAKIVDEKNEIFVITKGTKTSVCNKKGQMFSIFPFGCFSCTATLSGFMYELSMGELTSDFPLGISNVITSDNAEISVYNGNALCILYK